MGNCSCYHAPPEVVMREYWERLPIRGITPSIYKEFIKKEITRASNSDSCLSSLMSTKLFMGNDDKVNRVTNSILLNFIERHRSDYKLAILSLIFLTKPTSSYELFISLRHLVKHLDLDIIKSEHNEDFIEKRDLEKLLTMYVNLISLFCIDYVKNLQEDADFVLHLSDEYQYHYIETYVKKLIDSYINDNVLISKFLDNYMEKIIDDVAVRDGLHKLHVEEFKKPNMATTPGFR
jgi:hypothetical protein